MKELENKILDIIDDTIGYKKMGIVINDDTDLINELVVDSVLLMRLIAEIEESFDIEFDYDFDFENISSFGKLKQYIISKSEEK